MDWDTIETAQAAVRKMRLRQVDPSQAQPTAAEQQALKNDPMVSYRGARTGTHIADPVKKRVIFDRGLSI